MREAQRYLAPPLEEPPEHLTRAEREKWYRLRGIAQRRGQRLDVPPPVEGPDDAVLSKIAKFRRSFLGYVGITFMLFVINAAAQIIKSAAIRRYG